MFCAATLFSSAALASCSIFCFSFCLASSPSSQLWSRSSTFFLQNKVLIRYMLPQPAYNSTHTAGLHNTLNHQYAPQQVIMLRETAHLQLLPCDSCFPFSFLFLLHLPQLLFAGLVSVIEILGQPFLLLFESLFECLQPQLSSVIAFLSFHVAESPTFLKWYEHLGALAPPPFSFVEPSNRMQRHRVSS